MGNDEIPEVPSLENFHELTRKLWVDSGHLYGNL